MSDRPPGLPEPPGGWIQVDPPEGTPPLPPAGGLEPAPPPPSQPARGSGRWALVVVAAVAGGLAIGGAVAVLGGEDDREPAAEADPEPVFPDKWDDRVLPLVEFVEDERRLTFEHPVEIDFLSEAEWKDQGEIDEEEVLDEDAQLLEHGEGLFRAVGLAEGDLDLLKDAETLGTSGTLGLYRFDEQRITVRGEDLTPEVEATLAHELTHALQDQQFDIGDRLERVTDGDTTEGSLRVLVEGDADRIEEAWVAALPGAKREALERERSETNNTASDALEDLPASLVTFFASDYILGEGFMAVLDASDGTAAIDDAFETPPGPEEHVADPISFLEGDEPESAGKAPVDGEEIADMGEDFGAVAWFLMLAERTDPVAALAAVDGWGGDSFRAFTDDDDRTCAALRFIGEDFLATKAMEAMLDRWVTAMPREADASAERKGNMVDVTTCDPGPDAEVITGDGRSRDAISLFATRSTLAAQVLDEGGTNEQARCFSRGIIANLPYEVLVSSESSAEQQEQIEQVAVAQGITCR